MTTRFKQPTILKPYLVNEIASIKTAIELLNGRGTDDYVTELAVKNLNDALEGLRRQSR